MGEPNIECRGYVNMCFRRLGAALQGAWNCKFPFEQFRKCLHIKVEISQSYGRLIYKLTCL